MTRLTFLAVLVLACPVAAQDAPKQDTPREETIDTLMARFAKIPGLFAKFREEKHMTLLARPLINEGTLHFAPPHRVARHVTKPSVSSVLIDETTVRMGDGEHEDVMSLKGNPVLRQFLDSFMKILSGDRAALEKSYTLSLEKLAGEKPRWELKLEPSKSPMKDAIESISFVGDGTVLETMTMLEVGGDKTITTFSKVNHKAYTKAEWAEVAVMPKKKNAE
jgi:outer membrane lipoprotein-sorting protein